MIVPLQISVVIALYNKAPFIPATLSSALTQSLGVLEVIVVDDGSTDGGAEWVERQHDARVRLLRQPNSGVSRARNAGIAAARGDWVAFLDADDLWHPDYLSALATVARNHPGASAVGSMYRSVSAEQARAGADYGASAEPSRTPATSITDLPSRWLEGTCFFTSSVMVRRDELLALGPCFPPGEHSGEDLDLWFRLGERGPIALSPEPLVLRLWVPGSLSSGQAARAEPPYLLRLQARVEEGQTPLPLRRPTLHYVDDSRVTLARDLISRGERPLAWPLLRRSWRHATRHRWALTLLMLLLPGHAVEQFQSWRTRRRMVL